MECEVHAIVLVLMMFINLVCTFFPLAFGHFAADGCSATSEDCRGHFLFGSVVDSWQFSQVVVLEA